MTRTAAQTEASRSNGARSTGPTSPEGKAASAQNATRHGLCANTLTIAYFEDLPAFCDLLDGLRRAYRPTDAQEDELVHAIVLASWQVRRAQDMELQYWCWTPKDVVADPLRHIRQLDHHERHGKRTLDTIMRYQARAELARTRALRDLALYRSGRLHRTDDPAPTEPPTPTSGDTSTGDTSPANTNEPARTPSPQPPGTDPATDQPGSTNEPGMPPARPGRPRPSRPTAATGSARSARTNPRITCGQQGPTPMAAAPG